MWLWAPVSWGRRLACPSRAGWCSSWVYLFTRLFSQIRGTDAHNGFRAFSRHAAQSLCIRQNRMAHASEILDQIKGHGLHYGEVPVTIRYFAETTAKGQSSRNALRIVAQLVLGRMVR